VKTLHFVCSHNQTTNSEIECVIVHGFCGQQKSGKIREHRKIRKSLGILHSKVRENSEGQGKSGNVKVPGCKT